MVEELQSSRKRSTGTMARIIDEGSDIENEYEKLRRRLARGALNFISNFRFVSFISVFRFLNFISDFRFVFEFHF